MVDVCTVLVWVLLKLLSWELVEETILVGLRGGFKRQFVLQYSYSS